MKLFWVEMDELRAVGAAAVRVFGVVSRILPMRQDGVGIFKPTAVSRSPPAGVWAGTDR